METESIYPIILKEKIPYVSEFLLGVFSICCVVLAVCLFLFGPALSSNNEMKVVATVTIIPDNIKWAIFYSGIGFFIFRVAYKYLIIRKKGFLSFADNSITVQTKKNTYRIPILNIVNIKLVDPMNVNEVSKGKFFVVIDQVNFKAIDIQLKDYGDADSVIDNLLKYDILKSRIKSPETLREPDIINPDK